MHIVLVGGSGFLGHYLVNELVADGHRCTVLSRHVDRRGAFKLQPGVRLLQADVYDPDSLASIFEDADAVISMAGILNETWFGGKGFRRVHIELVKTIIAACKSSGLERLLHVSALNAGTGKSHYLVSKGRAEELLLAEKGLNTTIFRPAVIFGRGDRFFNRFATLLRMAWVMPLACGNSRMQPVYAGDVAAVMAASREAVWPIVCQSGSENKSKGRFSLRRLADPNRRSSQFGGNITVVFTNLASSRACIPGGSQMSQVRFKQGMLICGQRVFREVKPRRGFPLVE